MRRAYHHLVRRGRRSAMTPEPADEISALTRIDAQQRADRIAAFTHELADLERAGVLRLDPGDRGRLDAYHAGLLDQLARRFDVDRSDRQRRMSLGMRIASLVGAVTLSAAVVFFFYRVWGLLSTPVAARRADGRAAHPARRGRVRRAPREDAVRGVDPGGHRGGGLHPRRQRCRRDLQHAAVAVRIRAVGGVHAHRGVSVRPAPAARGGPRAGDGVRVRARREPGRTGPERVRSRGPSRSCPSARSAIAAARSRPTAGGPAFRRPGA